MRVVHSLTACISLAAMAVAQVTVMVGAEANTPGGIFQFRPANFTATNGTIVTFVFSGTPGNHTVAQSSMASPCQPAAGGFDSGYIQIPAGINSSFPTWNLTVTNDQEPIFFYCAQLAPSPHCLAGMVGTINASPDVFAAYQQAAINSGPTIPGAPSPNLVGVGASASAPPGPFSGSITGFAAPSATGSASNSSSGTSASSSGVSSASSPPSTSTSAPAVTTSASAATFNAASGLTAILASLFGIALL